MSTAITTIASLINDATNHAFDHPNNHHYNNNNGNISHDSSGDNGNDTVYNDTMMEMETLTSISENNPRMVNGVVVLLLMLFNIGGNSLVLYIYHSLFTNTVFNLFVKALASLDLLTAVTTMLIDVMMKLRHNNEYNLNTLVMCKMSHYQVYANSLASGSVLTLIAYQRYKKICHPLQRGMQLRQAKILLSIIGISSLIIAIPTVFLYGPRQIKVIVRSSIVHATICRADQNYQDSPMNLIFYYTLIIAFCVVLVSTCVLYFMVSRSIRKFEQRSSFLSASSPTSTTPRMDTINEEYGNGNHLQRQQDIPHTNRTLLSSPVHGRSPQMGDPFASPQPLMAGLRKHVVVGGKGQAPKNKNQRLSHARMSTFSIASSGNMISAQMYRVFSIITVVFIISYLPHLVALILTKVLKLDDKELPYVQRLMLEFAYNCPYISTVSNPLIYGFSSSEFRDRIRDLLQSWDCCGCCYCCCCCDDD